MKLAPLLAALVAAAPLVAPSGAQAAIPLVNATCGAGVEVHADQGGPVYINGKEAVLKRFNDNYYEAKGQGVTISLAINPDGSPNLSATWKGGKNGICTVSDGATPKPAKPKPRGCPVDVSQADRYKYPDCK
jgi:hypothetical protein